MAITTKEQTIIIDMENFNSLLTVPVGGTAIHFLEEGCIVAGINLGVLSWENNTYEMIPWGGANMSPGTLQIEEVDGLIYLIVAEGNDVAIWTSDIKV